MAAAPRVPRRARSPRRWRGSRASCRLPGSSSSACHPPAPSSRSEVLISILSGYRASHLSRVPHRLLASQRALAPDQPLHCPRVVRSGTLHNNSHLAPQAVSQSYHHCNLRIAASSRFLRFLVGLGTSWHSNANPYLDLQFNLASWVAVFSPAVVAACIWILALIWVNCLGPLISPLVRCVQSSHALLPLTTDSSLGQKNPSIR